MKKQIFLLVCSLGILLSACNSGAVDTKAKVVESYIKAVITQDSDQVSNLSCKSWEESAIMELDTFQTVKAVTEDLSCKSTGKSGETDEVKCNGKIVATYNEEKTEFDLTRRTYTVTQEGGDWRVCGVTQ
jgi:hypothetical protein